MEKVELQEKIVYQNRSLTLSLLEGNILLVAYKSRASNDEYRFNLSKQVELVKHYKLSKVVFDLRKMGVLSTDNQKYTSEVYMPEITKAGLKHSALIVPQDVFGEASAKSVTNRAKNEVVFSMQYFKDLSDAITWLTTL